MAYAELVLKRSQNVWISKWFLVDAAPGATWFRRGSSGDYVVVVQRGGLIPT